jgi:hypothetical protein
VTIIAQQFSVSPILPAPEASLSGTAISVVVCLLISRCGCLGRDRRFTMLV